MTEQIQQEQPMRDQLLTLVRNMRNEGVDFDEKHPIFRWRYEEEPTIAFSLKIEQINVDDDGNIVKEDKDEAGTDRK